MSLKAKLEAVIYAAEEPVTLAQLAGLFAEEALAWKAEQQAAAQAGDEAPEAADAETAEEPMELPLGEAADESANEAEANAAEETTGENQPDLAGAEPDGAGDAAADSLAGQEAEAKRAARQRDKEVRSILREILDEIVAAYADGGRGVEIREIAGGYRMATKPECHDAVRLFVKSLKPPLKLSLPALETLAVVAYKQPVTAPEVNEIRGVDSSGVFGSLLARKLISTAGRKQVIGRPILYKTTKEFLLRFGLKDISELPSMEEFEKIAASELEDFEPAAPESSNAENGAAASAEDSAPEPEPELDENANEDEVEASTQNLPSRPDAESAQPESESNSSEAVPVDTAPVAE